MALAGVDDVAGAPRVRWLQWAREGPSSQVRFLDQDAGTKALGDRRITECGTGRQCHGLPLQPQSDGFAQEVGYRFKGRNFDSLGHGGLHLRQKQEVEKKQGACDNVLASWIGAPAPEARSRRQVWQAVGNEGIAAAIEAAPGLLKPDALTGGPQGVAVEFR